MVPSSGLHPKVLGHVSLDVLSYSLKMVQPKFFWVGFPGWCVSVGYITENGMIEGLSSIFIEKQRTGLCLGSSEGSRPYRKTEGHPFPH